MVAAYIFLNDDESGSLASLRSEISDCASRRGHSIDWWVVNGAEGDMRKLNESLLGALNEGDTLYVEEISRLGATFDAILRTIHAMVRKDLRIYSVRDGFSTDGIGDVDTFLSTLSQMQDLFGRMVSQRTRAALEKRRRDGVTLGRPNGSNVKMRTLIDNREQIRDELGRGVSQAELCRRYNVSYSTFRRFAGIRAAE